MLAQHRLAEVQVLPEPALQPLYEGGVERLARDGGSQVHDRS
jgi:hypothetical protein